MNSAQKLTSRLVVLWVTIILILMGIGVSSGRIGTITWGPQLDMEAISIAISRNLHGLKGYLGYLEIREVLANHLTAEKDVSAVNNEGAKWLCYQPMLVSLAIKEAARKPIAKLRPEEKQTRVFYFDISDAGYADFYALAFFLFGYGNLSTHFLYITILAVSCLVLVVRFRGCPPSLAMLLLAVSALFMTSNSGVFSEFVPSVAGNRFLSTLALIPSLHLVGELISPASCNRARSMILMALQCIILSFAISCRSSALWTMIAMVFISLLIRLSFKGKIPLALLQNGAIQMRALTKNAVFFLPVLALLVSYAGATFWQNQKRDAGYFTDAHLHHHLVWHAAFIGLAEHPEWEHHMPFKELSGRVDDDIPYTVSEMILKKNGVVAADTPRDEIGARLHDRVTRSAYFDFLLKNKWYMVELYFFYKPISILKWLWVLFSSIRAPIWAFAVISVFLSSIMVSASETARAVFPTLINISGLLLLFSWLPLLWADSAPNVMGDQLWSALFLIHIVATFAVLKIVALMRFNGGRAGEATT